MIGLILLSVMASAGPLSAQVQIPGDSLYQLNLKLEDQHAASHAFDFTRGSPTLVTMFYANCKSACPLTITTLQQIEAQLNEVERTRLRVVLVSFDSQHDTSSDLERLAISHHISSPRWTLARADAQAVRQLAAALGIKYRRLENGEFTHSSVITLLDVEGRVVARTTTLTATEPEFIAQLKTLAAR